MAAVMHSGDLVISGSNVLRGSSCSEGTLLLGRIGGDEFVAFITVQVKGMGDRLGADLIQKLHHEFFRSVSQMEDFSQA